MPRCLLQSLQIQSFQGEGAGTSAVFEENEGFGDVMGVQIYEPRWGTLPYVLCRNLGDLRP